MINYDPFESRVVKKLLTKQEIVNIPLSEGRTSESFYLFLFISETWKKISFEWDYEANAL